ncbi:nuclear transport factor 2 family protein [Clostridium sp. LP20]|uniref:nuclear transport factor 2 family protein n=1 Tax=Clostridium sp. LP20 TaxID=3418665 RepID=UPI003EE70835
MPIERNSEIDIKKEIVWDIKKIVLSFLNDVITQNPLGLRTYFTPNAVINWHNTNESFTIEEYIIANCEYPGKWCGEVERIDIFNDLVISVSRLWVVDNSMSFHAVSFIKFKNDKIVTLDEYWGDDGIAPQWRLVKKIGKPIR